MTDAKPDAEPASADVPDPHATSSSVEAEPDDAGPEAPVAERRGLRIAPLTLLALIASLLAVAGTGFLWWQYRQFYVSLADADVAAADALERVRATQRSAADEIDQIESSLRGHDQTLRDLDTRLDAVPGQLAGIERRIDAVQGGTFDTRTTWLLAEAEYYLALANAELELAGNVETARAALRLADDRLRETADPALAGIRDLLADEIIALNAVRLVDTQGLAFSLGRLAERSAALPLRTQGPSRYSSDRSGEDAEPGLERLWRGVKDAFSSIVSVERRAGDVAMALSAEEERLARRQLALELQIARFALTRREVESYRASLTAARGLLERDFDIDAAEVESALALLDELLALEVAPALPDISRSLQTLRARSGAE